MASAALTLSSCSLDVNTDPNNPSSVTPGLELPSAESTLANVSGNGFLTPDGVFVQYYDQLPESEQYRTIVRYSFTQSEGLLDRTYSQLYAGALMDLQDIITSNQASAADKFAAECLRAYGLQLAVDNWDQAPYSQALHGSDNSSPVWDNGETIYRGILSELDSLQAQVGSSSMTATDMVCGRNISQWEGFANALRLRMYLRFIDANIDAAEFTQKVQTLVNGNQFFTGDIKFDNYADEADKRNPFVSNQAVNLNTTNLAAGYAIVSYMNSTGDTKRMAYNFAPAASTSTIEGCLPAIKYASYASDLKNNGVSELRYYRTMPVYFFTQAELQFLIAEVQLRFNHNDAAAKAAYEAGIAADFETRGLTASDAADFATGNAVSWDNASTDDAKLKNIYMQKWVSLFLRDHSEAWSEQRRTDVPSWSTKSAQELYNHNLTGYNAGDLIIPAVNSLGGSNVPERMFFPYSASQYNPNAPTVVPITKKVWWDVK